MPPPSEPFITDHPVVTAARVNILFENTHTLLWSGF